ncbi:MAG: hypothetical protein P8P84_20525, partial [Paracoccaceae bacterium]|nr:hypothetical protein [Paracoccaceae bacterium]
DKKNDQGDKEDPKEKGEDEDKKDGKDGDSEDESKEKPKDDKPKNPEKEGKGDEKKKQPPKPKPGQISPEQVKSLLEAMNNQEKGVLKKIVLVQGQSEQRRMQILQNLNCQCRPLKNDEYKR